MIDCTTHCCYSYSKVRKVAFLVPERRSLCTDTQKNDLYHPTPSVTSFLQKVTWFCVTNSGKSSSGGRFHLPGVFEMLLLASRKRHVQVHASIWLIGRKRYWYENQTTSITGYSTRKQNTSSSVLELTSLLALRKVIYPSHDHLLDSWPCVIGAGSTLLNIFPTPWYDDKVILTSISNMGYRKRR